MNVPKDDERWPRSVGGHVVLDLVNTAVYAGEGAESDVLRSATEFLAWCADNGLRVPGAAEPADGAQALEAANGLRAAVRGTVEALAGGRVAPPEALGALRSAYSDAVSRSAPAFEGGRLCWRHDAATATAVVDQLAVAAVDLLREEPTDRLKVCPGCGFVFLDTSKNRSRRWCSMDDCGKEEKMRRYVAKRAASRSGR